MTVRLAARHQLAMFSALQQCDIWRHFRDRSRRYTDVGDHELTDKFDAGIDHFAQFRIGECDRHLRLNRNTELESLSLSSPEGISTATIGKPEVFIEAIASANSPRTSFLIPVPRIASTMTAFAQSLIEPTHG